MQWYQGGVSPDLRGAANLHREHMPAATSAALLDCTSVSFWASKPVLPMSGMGRHRPVAACPAPSPARVVIGQNRPRLGTDEAAGHPPWSEPAGCSALSELVVQSDRNPHPEIGHLSLTAITSQVLLDALRKIEASSKQETARRAKIKAGQVFRWAIVAGKVETDPVSTLRGTIKRVKHKHHAAITDPQRSGNYRNKSLWEFMDLGDFFVLAMRMFGEPMT